MDQSFNHGFDSSHALGGGLSDKVSKRTDVAGSEGAVDRSELVRSIQSLIGMANKEGLSLLMALLVGVAERLEPSSLVPQPRDEATKIHRE